MSEWECLIKILVNRLMINLQQRYQSWPWNSLLLQRSKVWFMGGGIFVWPGVYKYKVGHQVANWIMTFCILISYKWHIMYHLIFNKNDKRAITIKKLSKTQRLYVFNKYPVNGTVNILLVGIQHADWRMLHFTRIFIVTSHESKAFTMSVSFCV